MRLDREERALYRLVGYLLVAWVLLFELGRRLLPMIPASGLTAFVVVLGSRFVDPARAASGSFARWAAFNAGTGVVVGLVLYGLGRFWPAG